MNSMTHFVVLLMRAFTAQGNNKWVNTRQAEKDESCRLVRAQKVQPWERTCDQIGSGMTATLNLIQHQSRSTLEDVNEISTTTACTWSQSMNDYDACWCVNLMGAFAAPRNNDYWVDTRQTDQRRLVQTCTCSNSATVRVYVWPNR